MSGKKKEINPIIGKQIKKAREMLAMEQQELAKRMELTKSAVSKVEAGLVDVNLSSLVKYADILGVSINYLLGCIEKTSPTPHIIAADTSNIDGKPTIIAQNPDFLHYDNIYPIESKKFPLLGAVACGEPIYSPEDTDVYIMANAEIKADFVLKAKGDSMINARIYDGDIVFIKAQPVVELGEIAAVAVDNEVTLKRTYYYPDKGKLILNPENPSYEPMVFIGNELNSIRILGKAVAFQSKIK